MIKCLLAFILTLIAASPAYAVEDPEPPYYEPPEESDAELVMDMFMSLLTKDIQKAVNNYYEDTLTLSPMVYPYQNKIVHMERTNGYRSFVFSVTLEVTPVVGPHIPVGRDRLTFTFSPGRIPTLTRYQHIETFKLPPHWQDIIKKKPGR